MTLVQPSHGFVVPPSALDKVQLKLSSTGKKKRGGGGNIYLQQILLRLCSVYYLTFLSDRRGETPMLEDSAYYLRLCMRHASACIWLQRQSIPPDIWILGSGKETQHLRVVVSEVSSSDSHQASLIPFFLYYYSLLTHYYYYSLSDQKKNKGPIPCPQSWVWSSSPETCSSLRTAWKMM